MQYTCHYPSPLGGIIVSSDGEAITGLWFDGRKYSTDPAAAAYEEKPLPLFEQAKRWLDLYFSGEEPPFVPAIRLHGSSFQLAVWEILRQIPYGQLVTYHDIAKEIARRRDIDRMAAQAVGGAVGRNPVSIMVPCHRVIGSDGSLTGYASGIEKKKRLLAMEKVEFDADDYVLQPKRWRIP
ncbi:methylated-DNA--[protein]-cysteine S-methyltransferase [Phocaeicola abscessus]|uniref:methylated-DNA--[protein]-cysteine S-methyltransferase n=1 Tax=Phocaeicola abscessus TaxID=555313 RepID=UPI0004B42366|nr:methylated-DNA--[protein]-cysteine S-methyltransferase [Phocaeicola abscessus]